jgi:hypothetical protein
MSIMLKSSAKPPSPAGAHLAPSALPLARNQASAGSQNSGGRRCGRTREANNIPREVRNHAVASIVPAEITRPHPCQIGALFELEDLGAQPLAGFAEPQRVWRVQGESGIVSRFEALRSGATPLVGRDEELDLLLRRWRQAKAGGRC